MKAFLARIERRFVKATLVKSEPETARQIHCALISIGDGAYRNIGFAHNFILVDWVQRA
jgi:hypothetical protein